MTVPLHIDRRKAGLRVRDVFFAEDAAQLPPGPVDLLYFLQSPVAAPGSTDFYTSLIDLRQDEPALLEGVNKGVRYEIRRARDKDGLQAVFAHPDDAQLARFFAFYDAFAASRDLGLVNRDKLGALRAAGALVLAWIPDPAQPDGPALCAHAYIVDGRRARLYHSASPVGEAATADRQRIGRANKLLHWQALQHFKQAGLACYDMGGISMGEALKAIDDFKRSFGGELVKESNRIEAASLRGRAALALLALKERLPRRSKKPADPAAARPVLHVIAGLSSGGAENFLLKLLQRDETLRARSAILSIRPQVDLLPQFEALGVPVERQPLQAHWRLPLRLWRIHRRINAPGTRLVQSWLYLADSVASLSAQVLGHVPLAWGIRSSHAARGKRLTGLLAQRLNPWLSKRYVQRIICCGERAREAHAALGYAGDKLVVIPNGYDTRRQQRDEAAGAALRAQWGIEPGAPVLGMAARIDSFKDHDTLLAAAALLLAEWPALRLVLCGKGTDSEALASRARELGLGDRLIGLGVRHDMQAVYSALDVHVLSSFTEGFPNVVAEAALHGCVSFSTPVGEAPEMLGDERWLVAIGDAPGMARAVADCLRATPGQRAAWAGAQRQRIEQLFELSRVAALYRETYDQMVPGLLPMESR